MSTESQPNESSSKSERGSATDAASDNHLDPEDFYDAIENRHSRKRQQAVETHLADCVDCAETLAMVLRCERPASRAEQEALAAVPEPPLDAVLDALRPHIEASASDARRRSVEWKPVVIAVVVLGIVFGSAGWLRQSYWLPAASRRIATETLRSMVDLRQGTGRIPLRYIEAFERAGVVRSGFDTTDHIELQLLDGLRRAVERAPETEAVLILGLLLLDDGELDEAERWLRTALDADARSVEALNGLAVISYERAQRDPDDHYGHLQRGLALLRQAQGLDPDELMVLYNYGKFYDALEMQGPAERAWARYLTVDRSSQWGEQAALELGAR